MVFQNYALFPHMTIFDNLGFPLRVRQEGYSETHYQVEKALEMVQLESFAQRYPGQLSGGQQQRVALARALVFKPKLVLMDEPLGALDKQLREKMQMEIKAIHKKLGVTVVYVTHDQSEALTMSDRVAVFNNGIIQQIDKPETLYEAPVNSFVANFIGENNCLAGVLLRVDGEYCLVKLDSGEEVRARAINVGQPGERVSLSIRPERVQINGASVGLENRFNGQIREFIYLGDHIRIRMEVGGSPDFIVKVPTGQLDLELAVGDVVPLGWSSEYVRALDPL